MIFSNACSTSRQAVQPDADQYLYPEELTKLPGKIDESSGLEYVDGLYYTIEDSGNSDDLFAVDAKGEIIKEVKVKDAKNEDWEDIAYANGTFYIGDFGNNVGNRDDLIVYAVTETDGDKADNKQIEFTYANQTNFKKQNHSHRYDCEAMVATDEKLLLFTKDWLDGNTELYELKLDSENDQTLSPVDSLSVGALITGADYDEGSNTLVLCGYMDWKNYVWVFKNSKPGTYFSKNMKKYELYGLKNAQVEGITFIDANNIAVSTEETDAFQEQIWTVTIQ